MALVPWCAIQDQASIEAAASKISPLHDNRFQLLWTCIRPGFRHAEQGLNQVETDDFLDIEPWPVAELAGQAIAHISLGRRGMIEQDQEADVFERETDRFELEAWARMELVAWLNDRQFRLLETPIGNLGEDQVAETDTALIVGSTIGWALRLVKSNALPIETNGADEVDVLTWCPTPWTPVRNVLKSLRARSDDALAAERERWELIHWRSTLFTSPEDREEDIAALAETIAEVDELGILPISDGDFAVESGQSFSGLSRDRIDAIQGIAETRLRTLNWVCGFGESPASAPLYLDDEEA